MRVRAFFAGIDRGVSVLLRAAAVLLITAPLTQAFASSDLGDAISNTVDQGYSNVPIFTNYIAYIGGAIVGVIGFGKLRNHFIKQDQPLAPALWHLLGAALLVSLPSMWALLVQTLTTDNPTGTTLAVATLSGSGGGTTLTLDQMMIDLVSVIKAPMGYLLWSLGVMLGLLFLVSAFLRIARNSGQDGPRSSMGVGTLGRILIGAILLSFAATADVFTTTIFGSDVLVFAGMDLHGTVDAAVEARANAAISAVLVFIQIIGFIAFMRGFLMLRAQADGASNVSTAASFTHLIGGAVAFNISSFLGLVQYTFCQGAASCNVFTFT